MTKKTFELAVLVSFMNDSALRGTTDEDKQSVLDHLYGRAVKSRRDSSVVQEAVSYLNEMYPKLKQASDLITYRDLDHDRYNKLTDLFRRFHEIESMPLKAKIIKKTHPKETVEA